MKAFKTAILLFCLFLAGNSFGQTQLTFRFANPRVIRVGGFDNFEFEVQAKASQAGTYFYTGQIILNFDNTTLSTAQADWTATRGSLLSGTNSLDNFKYSFVKTTSGTPFVLNLAITSDINVYSNGPNSTDYNEMPTSFQPLVTIRSKIVNPAGSVGISFVEASMNGQEFYISAPNTNVAYINPNLYESANFMTTFTGRLYSAGKGWSQVGNSVNNQWVDWTASVNTSVWDGMATIPTTGVSHAQALRIHDPAQLTIPSAGQLTSTGAVEINSAEGVLIQSTAGATGSLIAPSAGGIGTAGVERFMSGNKWHMISSPVVQTVSGFLSANANVPTKTGNRGMMDYNTATNVWNGYFTTGAGNGSLGMSKGFCLRNDADGNVKFTGTLQAGTINKATGRIGENGWNCIGNPYSSAIGINSNAGTTENFLVKNLALLDDSYGCIYVWDETVSATQYEVINNGSAAEYAPLGQGFFIKTKTDANQMLFTPSMQLHQNASALRSVNIPIPEIKLIAGIDGKQISTLIRFGENMSEGLDIGYDAGILKRDPGFSVFTKLIKDNGVEFAIQALPPAETNKFVIPVGIDSKAGAQVVFSSEVLNLPANCSVVLEDKLTNTFTRLDLKNSSYSATLGSTTSVTDRFRLLVNGQAANKELADQSRLIVYTLDKNIFIEGSVTTQAHFRIYNSAGQSMSETQAKSETLNVVDGSALPPGLYILNIKEKGRNESVKFVFGN